MGSSPGLGTCALEQQTIIPFSLTWDILSHQVPCTRVGSALRRAQNTLSGKSRGSVSGLHSISKHPCLQVPSSLGATEAHFRDILGLISRNIRNTSHNNFDINSRVIKI